MPEHVLKGVAEAGVRFHQFLLQALVDPVTELVHNLPAVFLVELKPSLG